jgi:voltage-gated potassium channel
MQGDVRLIEGWRYRVLLAILLATILLQPLLYSLALGQSILVLAYCAILAGGVYATRPEPWLSGLCSTLAAGLAGLNMYILFVGSNEVSVAFSVALIAVTFFFAVFVVSRTLITLVSAPAEGADALAGAVFGYFLLVVVWALFFRALDIWSPGAFTFSADGDPFTETLYFSLVTITTLGYGDVSPVAPFARISAGLEAATGTLYIAILIARIVGALDSRRL